MPTFLVSCIEDNQLFQTNTLFWTPPQPVSYIEINPVFSLFPYMEACLYIFTYAIPLVWKAPLFSSLKITKSFLAKLNFYLLFNNSSQS